MRWRTCLANLIEPFRPKPVYSAPVEPRVLASKPPERLPTLAEVLEEADERTTDPSIEPEDHMGVTLMQKAVIQSVVSAFETGNPMGDYAAVAVLSDGAGISYGKHQATDRSGTLDAILYRYADLNGKYANLFKLYLTQLEANASATTDPEHRPLWVKELMDLLRKAGEEDPVMALAQDQIFDELYWRPAADQALAMKLELPLSWLVVYDSTIHSGPKGVTNIRKRFPEHPPASGGDEKMWTRAYLNARRRWLSDNSNPVVQATVYRIDSMLKLIHDDNWALTTPFQLLKPKVMVT